MKKRLKYIPFKSNLFSFQEPQEAKSYFYYIYIILLLVLVLILSFEMINYDPIISEQSSSTRTYSIYHLNLNLNDNVIENNETQLPQRRINLRHSTFENEDNERVDIPLVRISGPPPNPFLHE